jgi:hypothetical protein
MGRFLDNSVADRLIHGELLPNMKTKIMVQ